MNAKTIPGFAVLLVWVAAASADDFPSRLEGKWRNPQSGAGGNSVIELVKGDGPDKALVKVDLGAVPNGHGGTCYLGKVDAVAEHANGAWTVKVPHPRCPVFTFTMKAVEGKNRLEGSFQTDMGQAGSVYFDGK